MTSGATGCFLDTDGKLTKLPAPAGSNTISAGAINDKGEIAGSLSFSSGAPSHAASYSNGIWTDLGAIAGALSTSGAGIIIAGEVVGAAIFPISQYHPFKPGKHVAFVSLSGSAVADLNTLISAGTGFTITDAVGINDSGQILCNATNSNGEEHAVLLTP